jgi:hypothetical protein
MTHTLHRQGTKESLSRDYIMHCMPAKGFNKDESTPDKLRHFLDIVREHVPVNSGESSLGNQYVLDPAYLHDNLTTITHGVYSDEETFAGVLKDVKEAEIGLSVTLSGLSEKLFACCKKAGIKPYAVEHSLGVLGNKDRMPDEDILQITTMCGHAMLSQGLIRRIIEKIKTGKMTPTEAGIELAKPCQCGVFNPVRAAELLDDYCALYSVSVK